MTLQRIIGRVAVMGLIGTASASICSAREYATPYDNHPTLTVTAGQGGYIRLPDLTPMPSSYALTGEMQENRQSLRDWQRIAGPIFQIGNARIVLPPTR